ncbi:MAG: NosD domain-containing protein [Hyalangium sp.]|uniref:NosD domain-containing protein n=1 Tax=Hyalangium sp. TaxID=2028555 RepID=UPI003899A9B7
MRCERALVAMAVGMATFLARGAIAKSGGAGESASGDLHCGDTITTSTRLTHDLACPGAEVPALRIAGTGVVLDLGGHTVRHTGPEAGLSEGIAVLADSTVKNGTIRGFDLGYVVDYDAVHLPEHVWLSRLVFLENGDAIYNRSSNATFTLTDSVLIGNGVGMGSEQDASRGAFEVRSSLFIDNRLALTANSHTVDVSYSTFSRNESVIWCPDGSVSFTSSVITQNTVVGQITVGEFGYGVCNVASFTNTVISRNGALAPSSQPAWEPFNLVLHGSRVIDNGNGLVGKARTVDVQGNIFRGNEGGLTLAEPAEFLVPTLSGTVSGNRFQRNRGTGLLVTTASTLTVSGNTAIDNTGWGIFAPGVIDGGGNVARGNGAGNCLGVACASHLTAETPLLSEEEAPGAIEPMR